MGMELIYKNMDIVEMIHTEVDKVRNVITDTGRLEDRIYKRIARYINGDPDRLKHFLTIRKMIYEDISDFKRRRQKELYSHFGDIYVKDDEGKEVEYEPVDDLADVEGVVIAKEMTALLAQDDHRKKLVLGNWINGNYNNSDISRVLADSLGGNPESYRKFIQRFRNECRRVLSTAI